MAEQRLTWEDPPPRRRDHTAQVRHQEVTRQLKESPGDWACVGTYETASTSASMAYLIRSGRLAAYRPAGAFQARARFVDEEYRVYAVYVGEAGDERSARTAPDGA